MRISELSNNIREKKTYLCLGLDTDIEKIPEFLLNFEDAPGDQLVRFFLIVST